MTAKKAGRPAKKTSAKAPSVAGKITKGPVTLLVGTQKGAFILSGDQSRKTWKISKPIFLGHVVYHMVLDPRDNKTILMATKTGHLGPTVFRSTDKGKTWKEAKAPPAFDKVKEGEKGRVVESVFWVTPGHASEPGVWYAGTSPAGLFRSEDGGETWEGVNGFNKNPMLNQWAPGWGTPGGELLHSIIIDKDEPRHMYLGISVGGIFESFDKGVTWHPLNKGCAANFLPDPNALFGHDPHCMIQHPLEPNRLYQQNHCGIYRLDRPAQEWVRIGVNMPKKTGDIGFPIVAHPRDPNKVWVFPMDGTDVWPRTCIDAKPAVFMSANGGNSWKQQTKGLPKANAYFTVKRQAMCTDHRDKLGVYFGTTQGEIWASRDEGASWACLVKHIPHIYSVTVAEFQK